MKTKKKIDLEKTILNLFSEKNAISLQDIAKKAHLEAGMSTHRRAIQRALKNLIAQDILQPQGNARARVYLLKEKITESTTSPLGDKTKNVFRHVELSNESVKLLHDISKPIRVKQPIKYNRGFLKKYNPNHTFYLPKKLREELCQIGSVENVVRPAGTYARNILNRLLIDLSWNSSRLEGNTYSLLETQRLIELGETAGDKEIMEAQMILNHKNAIEYIIESAKEKSISPHEIHSIHALLSDNLLGDPSASGRLRKISVGISGTPYLPLDNPHVLEEYFTIFIEKINKIKDPFEQSFFSLVHLSYLQAFEDVNKRTSRLVANIPLIKKNLKPLSFINVNQKDYALSLLGVYEKNDIHLLRDLYVWAYKQSAQRYSAIQQNMGEPNIFKLKYRNEIQTIVRTIILNKTTGSLIVASIKNLIQQLNLLPSDSAQLLQVIELELLSLHAGNIARFRIRPSEYDLWRKIQN